jgi:hypothetical protein
MTISYQLSIAPELEQFRSEIEFACHFLDDCHYLRRDSEGDAVLHYGSNPPDGAMQIPNVLFPTGVVVNDNGIYPDASGLSSIETKEIPNGLFPDHGGTQNSISDGRMNYDALGLIFLLLSRLEERGNAATSRDRYGRFPFDASIVHRHARLDIPLADLAALDIAGGLGAGTPAPNRTSYEVQLTHDLDKFRGYHKLSDPLLPAAVDLLKRRDPLAALLRLNKAYRSGEPELSVRNLMQMSEDHGFSSRFFVMGPTSDSMNSPYAIKWPAALRRLTDEISSRGHSIGFHPGVETASNQEMWNQQKVGLERIVGQSVDATRQHALINNPETTFDICNSASMKSDYSLGFPELSGFRTGTCRPHRTFSLVNRTRLDLKAYPTSIMDFGFFGGKYRDLSVDQALEECDVIVETCRSLGGTLVVLFHTHQNDGKLAEFYRRLLDRL